MSETAALTRERLFLFHGVFLDSGNFAPFLSHLSSLQLSPFAWWLSPLSVCLAGNALSVYTAVILAQLSVQVHGGDKPLTSPVWAPRTCVLSWIPVNALFSKTEV